MNNIITKDIDIAPVDIGGGNIEKNIADNIKSLRLQAGLKQSELGDKIAYSDKTISKWEKGMT